MSLSHGQAGTLACAPVPQLRAEIEKAITTVVAGPDAAETVLPALAALRDKYPNDLFVHEAYQNAVQTFGVQGHFRILRAEYRVLASKHPDDPLFRYLYLRSLLGNNTKAVTTGMNQLVAEHPSFWPAFRTLAEIYQSGIFRDDEKRKSALSHLTTLCLAAPLPHKLDALPDKSPLLGQAEQLVAQGGDPDRVASLCIQALKDDEWRRYRIRVFDWYSVEFKREALLEMRLEYLQAWAIQIRAYRKTGNLDKPAQLLGQMEQATAALRAEPDTAYWEALTMLASVYLENKQTDKAASTLERMQKVLADHPDSSHAATLESLRQNLVALTK